MKTSFSQKLLFSFAITLFFSFTSFSQFLTRSNINQQNYQVIVINNYPIRVFNSNISDAIGANGSISHSIAFNFNLNKEDQGLSNLLSLIQNQNSKTGYNEWSFSFYNINFNGDIVEQRNYSAINVQEFSLSPFDAAEKNTPVKGNVRLTALKMNLIAANGKSSIIFPKNENAFTNTFSLSLGNLPTRQAINVSPLLLTPSGPNGINFTITLNATNIADWNREFASGNTNNLQGTIQLLGSDGKSLIKTIYISNAKILSISTINNPIARMQVVLNAQAINIQ